VGMRRGDVVDGGFVGRSCGGMERSCVGVGNLKGMVGSSGQGIFFVKNHPATFYIRGP